MRGDGSPSFSGVQRVLRILEKRQTFLMSGCLPGAVSLGATRMATARSATLGTELVEGEARNPKMTTRWMPIESTTAGGRLSLKTAEVSGPQPIRNMCL